MTIASHIEGRLRVRDPRLCRREHLEALRDKLLGSPDVQEVSGNVKTGSVLILYRKVRNAFQNISELIAEALPPLTNSVSERLLPSPAAVSSRKPVRAPYGPLLSKRRIINMGMLITLLGTLVSLGGSKHLHAVAGVIFLAILSMHFLDKRKTLFI